MLFASSAARAYNRSVGSETMVLGEVEKRYLTL